MTPTDTAAGKIRIGISSCLLGERVRFDGGHKLDLCGFVFKSKALSSGMRG